jgi:hypothetical protein
MAPPTEVGSTVTVVAAEVEVEQTPLWITALYCVVWVSAPDVKLTDPALPSLFQVLNGDTELSHRTTLPV